MATERVQITDLRDAYVICRTLGHSWDDNPTAEVDSAWLPFSVGVIALRCERCTMERLDYIGRGLDVVYRRYVPPEHYTSIPGEGSRPNLRGELIRRSLLIRTYGR